MSDRGNGVIHMGLLNVIRRMALKKKLPIREIARRTGLSRNTIKKYLKAPSAAPLWRQASCARINPCFAS